MKTLIVIIVFLLFNYDICLYKGIFQLELTMQGCFVLSLIEIGSMVFIAIPCTLTILLISLLGEGHDH